MTDKKKVELISPHQIKKYTISGINGIDIEVVGDRNMKAVAQMLSGYKLKIKFDKPDKNKK